jgi:tRNA A-37 threonylcarbamoyl transferase component Bud32
MKCQKCGTQLEPEARFCGSCGNPVTASIAPARAIAPQPAPPQVPSQSVKPPGGNKLPSPAEATVAMRGSGPVGGPPPASPRPQGTPAPIPMARPVAQPAPAPAPRAPAGPPAPPRDPYLGKTLNNRYLIEDKLGEGGFGAVYRAKQVQIGRQVALKLLHPDTARDPNLVARFRREGAVACSLKDAHTITTYDFDQTPEGVLYIAMELLTGRSLHDVFHAEAPLHWMRVLHVLEQMCSSLGEAHTQGIVHRDLKPENIYLEKRPGDPEFVKILDFGIAKIVSGEIGGQSPQLTASGQTLGTLEYMSPEQLMGKQLDGRSDVYAMGVLAYELLTGRLPFPDAVGPAALIAAQLKKTPEPPSVAKPTSQIPGGVDQLVLKMLEKDKAKRHADVAEVAEHCKQLLVTSGAAQGTSQGAAAAAPGAAAGVSFRAATPAPMNSGGIPQAAAAAPSAPVSMPSMATPGPGQMSVGASMAAPPPRVPPPPGPSTQAVIRESGASSRKNLFFAVALALAVTIGIVLALVLKK